MNTKPICRTRKTERGQYTLEIINKAVDRVLKDGLSVRAAALEFNLSHKTLGRYVKKQEDSGFVHVGYSLHRRIFPDALELELSDYIKLRAKMCYGLTRMEIRKAAYLFAECLGLAYPEQWGRDQMAGEEWLRQFRSRHPDIRLKKPESCTPSRATSFNKSNVGQFFDNLEAILKKKPQLGDGLRIFNLDEIVLSTVQSETLVTACCIISASGTYLPPAMIFPRHNCETQMIHGAPPGTLGLANPSGWMTVPLFEDVMRHFVEMTNSTVDNPSLLIYDNHESHVGPIAVRIAKENGVYVLTIPPHCSDKMQPLNLTVYRSLMENYDAAADSWLINNPGKTISIYEVAALFGTAFSHSMTPENIQSGFKTAGIFPYDRNVFPEESLYCSKVTDRPDPVASESMPQLSSHCQQLDSIASSSENTIVPSSNPTMLESIPSTSAITLLGLPQAEERKTSGKWKRARSTIVANTPELESLEENAGEKSVKLQTQAESELKQTKRKWFGEEPSVKKKTGLKKPQKKQKKGAVSSSNNSDDESPPDLSLPITL